MKVEYKNKSIEKVCTNASFAIKKHGSDMAEKINQRIGEIIAADSVEQMIQYQIGRCHQLHQNRKSQYAVDLVHPYRLIFEKKEHQIRIVNLIEILDSHYLYSHEKEELL